MTTPSQVLYRLIPLTQGQYALVDEEDYERIAKHKWYARWSKGTQTFYAVRNIKLPGKLNQTTVLMHREILGLEFGDKRVGEHRKPDQTLDNRKSNLRIATQSQNGANCRKNRKNTSGFKGVVASKKLWRARIWVNRKMICLGRYKTIEEAANAYRDGSVRLRGEFARIS